MSDITTRFWYGVSFGSGGGLNANSNSGLKATRAEAEDWAKKHMEKNGNITNVGIFECIAMVRRANPPIEVVPLDPPAMNLTATQVAERMSGGQRKPAFEDEHTYERNF